MGKGFSVEFDSLEAGEGILDLALRTNVNTGQFEFIIEEAGLPITVPYYQFCGLLTMMINHSSQRFFHGYPDKGGDDND